MLAVSSSVTAFEIFLASMPMLSVRFARVLLVDLSEEINESV